MKSPYLRLAPAFALMTALAILLSKYWSPPGTEWVFFGISAVLGGVALWQVYARRHRIVTARRKYISAVVIVVVAIGLSGLLVYYRLHDLCVIESTVPEWQKYGAIYFPLWLEGEVAEDLKGYESRLSLVNDQGPGPVANSLTDMPGIEAARFRTTLILLLPFQLLFASLVVTSAIISFRLLELFEKRYTRRMDKIKILFLAANPKGTDTIDLAREARTIEERILATEHRDSLELITKWAVRPDDLLQSLNQHQPHVVHFSAHGEPSNEILLEGVNGEVHRVSGDALRDMFRVLKDNVRLVVLNACYLSDQAVAITENIDCAIGMTSAVPDEAAIDFAASLYRAIGFGRSVKNAFDQGVVSLKLKNIAGSDLPRLHQRQGVDPADVVLIEPNVDDATLRATAPATDSEPEDVVHAEALTIWKEKLAFLQRELAKAAAAEQKFAIEQGIKEAKQKITELGGQGD